MFLASLKVLLIFSSSANANTNAPFVCSGGACACAMKSTCTRKLKSRVLRILARKCLCNVNFTRALNDLYLQLTSLLGQIRDPWHSQAFTLAHIVIGLSLHIHYFIHLRLKHPSFPVVTRWGLSTARQMRRNEIYLLFFLWSSQPLSSVVFEFSIFEWQSTRAPFVLHRPSRARVAATYAGAFSPFFCSLFCTQQPTSSFSKPHPFSETRTPPEGFSRPRVLNWGWVQRTAAHPACLERQ